MLRFIKHNMTSMENISIYPIISLLIFTIFFALILWYVIKMNRNHVNEMSDLPLIDNEITQTNEDK
jgi:cytochrome c oxidase cbb3-type subunit 4